MSNMASCLSVDGVIVGCQSFHFFIFSHKLAAWGRRDEQGVMPLAGVSATVDCFTV